MVLAGFGFHFHYNTSIHLEETTVGVPGELCIAGLLGKGFDHFVVNPEIKNGVHHARHRLTSPGANGKKKGVLKVTKLLAHSLFDLGNICLNLGIESLGVFLPVVVIIGANFGRNGETSGNRNSNAAHFGEIGAFAA